MSTASCLSEILDIFFKISIRLESTTNWLNTLARSVFFQTNKHGFASLRSTADISYLNKKEKAEAVALAISKMFGRVWSAGLLPKLKDYDINGQMFDLIQSFVTDHDMKVTLNDYTSLFFTLERVTSILGHILFVVFQQRHS